MEGIGDSEDQDRMRDHRLDTKETEDSSQRPVVKDYNQDHRRDLAITETTE